MHYGTYTLTTHNDVYQNKTLSFNLITPRKSILLNFEKRIGPFLIVEPQHSYVDVCPDNTDFSTIRVKNEGFESLNVTITPTNSIIYVENNRIIAVY